MTSEIDIYRTTDVLIREHGEDAALEAAQSADSMLEKGSLDGHALERGASMALVRDSVGHSSVSTTNGYLHARPNDSSALYLAV